MYAFNSAKHVFWFSAALTLHQCLFLVLAGQTGALQFLTLIFPPQLWLSCWESGWLIPPLSIYPDRCIVSSVAASVGVWHNWQQCWGHVSLGFHVWLAAKVVLKEFFFFMKMNLVIHWWLITVKEKQPTWECPFFFYRIPADAHRHALPHTHTKYRNWKWLTAA